MMSFSNKGWIITITIKHEKVYGNEDLWHGHTSNRNNEHDDNDANENTMTMIDSNIHTF